jgi:GTP-binding protein Era
MTRAGFVAVIGAPNSGKSTLVNRLVGSKVSIVSRKVQTTRFPIRGVASIGESQIVLVDTPGIFKPRRRLDRAMVGAAFRHAREADVVLHLVDASNRRAASLAEERPGAVPLGAGAILVLNKVDLVSRGELLPLTARLFEQGRYSETFMISALDGDGVEALKVRLAALMPPAPWFYPRDQTGDLPARLMAAEVTREQLYDRVHQELPYATGVETTAFEELADGSFKIQQLIYVEREGQRAILIGKGGRTLKSIGQASRRELARILGRPAHVFLHVKVKEHWSEDRGLYEATGLDFDA